MALKATTTTKSINENNNINNKIKQKVLKITSTNSTTSPCYIASTHPCGCACVHAHAWGIQYYDYIIIWGFNVYIIIDLVERRVLTLVGEIRRYRNDRYRYYY